jgi:hypothetical protein
MKTVKDIIWDHSTGFGAVKFDNGYKMAVTIIEGDSRPFQGIVYSSEAQRVEDAEAFDFTTEESLNIYMERIQKKEAVAA